MDVKDYFKEIISFGKFNEPKNLYNDVDLTELCDYIESKGYSENTNVGDKIGHLVFMDKKANRNYLDGNVIWISFGSKYVQGNYAWSMPLGSFLVKFREKLSFNPYNDCIDFIKEWCYINDISKKDSYIGFMENEIWFKVNYDINISDLKKYLSNALPYDIMIDSEDTKKGLVYMISLK